MKASSVSSYWRAISHQTIAPTTSRITTSARMILNQMLWKKPFFFFLPSLPWSPSWPLTVLVAATALGPAVQCILIFRLLAVPGGLVLGHEYGPAIWKEKQDTQIPLIKTQIAGPVPAGQPRDLPVKCLQPFPGHAHLGATNPRKLRCLSHDGTIDPLRACRRLGRLFGRTLVRPCCARNTRCCARALSRHSRRLRRLSYPTPWCGFCRRPALQRRFRHRLLHQHHPDATPVSAAGAGMISHTGFA